MRTPRGHIRRHGNRYEIAVPVGRDPITKRYRYVYDSASTEEEAERRRAVLTEQITKGRAPQARATVSDLIDRRLSVAELELITTVNYQSYIERVIRPVLGGMQLREIQNRVEVLDRTEALGGRLTIVSPPGQGTRLTAELPLPDDPGPQGPGHHPCPIYLGASCIRGDCRAA